MATQLPDPIKIFVKRAGNVRIHTFISAYTDNNIANATHIIENKNTLVLIDSQFLATYATQFRAYADSLGKPIERLYLSHRHPDHWFGLGTAFSDVPIYALQETQDFIAQNGEVSREDHVPILGSEAPSKIVVPQNVVAPGEETIDGLTYVFTKVVDTEIDYLLTIQLPQIGVYVAQDLIYSGTHLYLTKNFDHWISILQNMLISDYDLFLPGHGLPADKNEIARNIEYLAAAKEASASALPTDANEASTNPSKYDFKTYLLNRYPERLCPGIFNTYLPRLFDGAPDF